MLWHFIISFGRNLRANKALTLINVLSLSLGLAVFAIASLYVQRELSYDHEWPNAERIHRLVIQSQGVPGSPDGLTTSINPSSYQAFLSYFSEQIEAATRLASEPVQVGEVDKGGINFLTFVDPAFADIFSLEVLEGSLTQVLANPGLIALTEAMAEILGESGRVGQRLQVKATNGGGEQEFEVGAIVRLPELTTQPIQPTDMLAVFSEYAAVLFTEPSSAPWEVSTFIRLLLKPGEGTQEFNEQMPDFVESTFAGGYDSFDDPFETSSISERLFYELEPIQEIYLDGLDLEAFGGDKAKVITFGAVGLLVLLVGCSNSASLSFANALHRRREVGIRKASGADKQTIMLHYLGESVLLALASCVLALALQELLLAPVQALLNISGELSPSLADSGLLLAIAVLIGLINGAYPAFVLSELRPQSVLKPNVGSGSKGVFRARVLLVGGQLTLTIMFLASAFTLYAQLMVMQAQPLGYDHRNLLYFSYTANSNSSSAPSATIVANNVLDLPGVVAAVPMLIAIPNMNLPLNINAVSLVSKLENEMQVQATRWMIAEGFPEMVDIPLLAGRALDSIRDSWSSFDLSTTVEHALITRRAAEMLGFASPERAVDELIYMRGSDASGQPLDAPLLIVGVLEDNLYSSIHRLPVPEFYVIPAEFEISQFMLRYEPSASRDIQQDVAALFEPYDIEPSFYFIENRIEAAYFQDRSESRLLLIAAGMALLLSCIGMYGLVATIMARSVKEVGVRKAMGASTASLLGLFLWRFSRPALFVNLIAWPLAAWFVLRWIQRFPYQIDLAWLPALFFSASLLVLLVAWLTIVAVTARAAQWKASKSLRYE